jgi:hypothetical protein
MENYLAMTEHAAPEASPAPFTGRDVLYREKGVSALDVQRAADALLRRGQKPSIATVREQLGGGSPNTLAPLLEQYWKALGSRVAAGPEALERVPESLARMTEALWLRSLDEARQRARTSLAGTTPSERDRLALEGMVTELTAALAASRARASELESQLLSNLQDGRELRTHVGELTALLKAEQALRAQVEERAQLRGRETQASRTEKRELVPRRLAIHPRRKEKGSAVKRPKQTAAVKPKKRARASSRAKRKHRPG